METRFLVEHHDQFDRGGDHLGTNSNRSGRRTGTLTPMGLSFAPMFCGPAVGDT